MAKTTLGFPDPDRDPMRGFRSLFATQNMLRDIQKQPFKDMQKSMQPFRTADLLKNLQWSIQPFQHDKVLRDIQKTMQPIDTSKVLTDIQKSMQPFKGVQAADALAGIEPFKVSNVLADIQKSMQTPAFKQTLDRSLARAAVPDLSSGIVETLRKSRIELANLTISPEELEHMGYVREVQAEVRAQDEDAPSILGDWIWFLSDAYRRRLFLVSVAALSEALAYSAAVADQELPIHLDQLILFLLTLCEGLSIYLFDRDEGDEPQDPAPEDEDPALEDEAEAL